MLTLGVGKIFHHIMEMKTVHVNGLTSSIGWYLLLLYREFL